MGNGGKRKGAGRKKTLKSEIIATLRDKLTDKDYDLALTTLRDAMNDRKKNMKTALSAAQFVIEQKIGKPSQAVDLTTGGEKLVCQIVYGK